MRDRPAQLRDGFIVLAAIQGKEPRGLFEPRRRRVEAGERVGYGGTFVAERTTELAIVNAGYADGYLRGFSGSGRALIGGKQAAVVGRVSMDLTAICVDEAPEIGEGDWIALDYHLPAASAQSGLSQYELLTTLGSRFERVWR